MEELNYLNNADLNTNRKVKTGTLIYLLICVGFRLKPILANDPVASKNVAHFKSGHNQPKKVTQFEGSQFLADTVVFISTQIVFQRNIYFHKLNDLSLN